MKVHSLRFSIFEHSVFLTSDCEKNKMTVCILYVLSLFA